MINITRSQPAPACLALEKIKKNGKYNCEDVFERLSNDFLHKCYLCEKSNLTKAEIDHFKPHLGGKKKERIFDWNNLFFCCSRCNRIKWTSDIDLLDCTNSEHKITEWIKFGINIDGLKGEIRIEALQKTDIVQNTVDLLDDIYNTPKKKYLSNTVYGAYSLKKRLMKEITPLYNDINNFQITEGKEREYYRNEVKKQLKISSPFSAFKLWIVKENAFFRAEFLDS